MGVSGDGVRWIGAGFSFGGAGGGVRGMGGVAASYCLNQASSPSVPDSRTSSAVAVTKISDSCYMYMYTTTESIIHTSSWSIGMNSFHPGNQVFRCK